MGQTTHFSYSVAICITEIHGQLSLLRSPPFLTLISLCISTTPQTIEYLQTPLFSLDNSILPLFGRRGFGHVVQLNLLH